MRHVARLGDIAPRPLIRLNGRPFALQMAARLRERDNATLGVVAGAEATMRQPIHNAFAQGGVGAFQRGKKSMENAERYR